MPFKFTKNSDQLVLTLSGDIDLEITPDVKNDLAENLDEVSKLEIDGQQVNYIDSSGISILVIAMQSCKQKNIDFSISKASNELMRVIELAHLDKLLTINEQTGPADLVDVDVFSDTGANDKKIVENIYQNDDDLIAQELADLGGDETASSAISDASSPSDENTQENNQNTDPEAASDTEKPENSGLFKPGTF
ncbi:MAG: anti-sigma factor antagonist [Alphaproteobacteria bacterium]|jgi:anti-anti-sigma factor|nr:anti-sigma factor antagonist [Alphaproteobacteria bacterium]